MNNSVVLGAGQSIKHVVQFDTVTVGGVIGVRDMKGMVLTTTGGTAAGVGGANKDTIYMAPKGHKASDLIVPARFRKGAVRFGVIVTEKRATFYWVNDQLGGESTEPGAGQIMLHGGDSGFAYGNIVISGKVNRAWAQKFFGGSEK